ncbi:hypothetical protein O6H91_01G045600 [Diphasiastrum complanatum]|uniref:Uncharacterized protein n=1 Tax=Diphasiastrum complanatum TaxID=34168 RepID=A0ACC2EQP5_DIPCM|nr:hypothetical protein O6H91_01G045600 [Diphasiastrum complanatum]
MESAVWAAAAAAAGGSGTSGARELTENDLSRPKGKGMLQVQVQVPMRDMDVESLRERTADVRVESADEQEHQLHLQQYEGQKLSKMQQTGGFTCKECGNQAKKDCAHQRCRTCCKSRGFDCPTHIKSTWVPAAKRRHRQASEAATVASGEPSPKPKRTRSLALCSVPGSGSLISPTSAAISPHSSDVNIQTVSLRGAFPSVVRAQALFKCVRVTGVEDGEDEYAYQATVKIGGHVFKGVLYDQGLDIVTSATYLADLQLGGRTVVPNSSPVEPAGMYGPSGSALFGALR